MLPFSLRSLIFPATIGNSLSISSAVGNWGLGPWKKVQRWLRHRLNHPNLPMLKRANYRFLPWILASSSLRGRLDGIRLLLTLLALGISHLSSVWTNCWPLCPSGLQRTHCFLLFSSIMKTSNLILTWDFGLAFVGWRIVCVPLHTDCQLGHHLWLIRSHTQCCDWRPHSWERMSAWRLPRLLQSRAIVVCSFLLVELLELMAVNHSLCYLWRMTQPCWLPGWECWTVLLTPKQTLPLRTIPCLIRRPPSSNNLILNWERYFD